MGVPVVTITSEGQKLDPVVQLLGLEVRRELNRVPEASLRLLDGSVARRKFEVSDSGFFEPGKQIAIAVRIEGRGEDVTLFEGLVVRHAVEAHVDGSSLRIELKDAAFKLTRQRKSAVFRDQSDDEAIRKLVGDAGLDVGELETGKGKHKELVQYYASDWDFILSRADVQGLVVDVDRGKLSLRKMVPSGAAKAKLEQGLADRLELDLELDAGSQWAKMTSVAWDVQNQAPTSGAEAADPGVVAGNLDPAEIAKKLGGDGYTLVHPALLADDELQAWADSRLARSRLAFLRGTIALAGRSDLAPLDLIEIGGVGARYDGKAMISGVTHRVDTGGWRTELRLGLPPEWFARQSDIVDLAAGGLVPAVQGLHVGVVTDYEDDPLGELRVKVQLPVLDQKQGPIWARLAAPDAGNGRGWAFWPEPGDEVVVGFVYGDPRQAIVLGALHGSTNAPPDAVGGPSQKNEKRGLVSKGGTIIGFDDDKKSVRIETPGGNKIRIDDDAKAITVADQHGNTITLDDKGITLKCAKDLTIDASGKVVIKGQSVDVQ